MTESMQRLMRAVELAQHRTNPRQRDMREAIVESVLQGLHDITMDRAEESIHEAQVHRYTTIAVHRVLHGGLLST
jgi:hypothetical protein